MPDENRKLNTIPNVGASLLAMAVCQSPLKSTVSPLSRASSLPQGLPVSDKLATQIQLYQPPNLFHRQAGANQRL